MSFGNFDDMLFGTESDEAKAPKKAGKKEDSFDFEDFNFEDPIDTKEAKGDKQKDNMFADLDDLDFSLPDDKPADAKPSKRDDDIFPSKDVAEPEIEEVVEANKEKAAAIDSDPFGGLDDFVFGDEEPKPEEKRPELPVRSSSKTKSEKSEQKPEEFDDFGDFNDFGDFGAEDKPRNGTEDPPEDIFDDFAVEAPSNKSSERSSSKPSRSSSKKSFLSAAKQENKSGEQPRAKSKPEQPVEQHAPVEIAQQTNAEHEPAVSNQEEHTIPEQIPVELPEPIEERNVYNADEDLNREVYPEMGVGTVPVGIESITQEETGADVSAVLQQILHKLDNIDDGKEMADIEDQLRDAKIAQRELQDDLMSFEANIGEEINQSVGSHLGLINQNYQKLSALSEQLEQKIEEADQREQNLQSQGNEIQKTNISIEERRREVVQEDEDVEARERQLEELRESISQMQFQTAEVLNSAKEALQEMNSAKQVFERKTLSINLEGLQTQVQEMHNKLDLIETAPAAEQLNPQAIRNAVKLEIQEVQETILQMLETELSQNLEQLVLEPIQREFLNYTQNIQRSFDDQASELAGIVTTFKEGPQGENNTNLVSFLNAQFIKLQEQQNCEAHVASIKIANERAASAENKLREEEEDLLCQKDAARTELETASTLEDELREKEREVSLKIERNENLQRELEEMREEMFEREKRLVEKEQTAALQIQEAQERKKRIDIEEYQLGKAKEELENQKEEVARDRLILKHEKTEIDVEQMEEQNQRTFNLYRAYSVGKQQLAAPAATQAVPSSYAITKQNLEQAMQRASRLNSSAGADDRINSMRASYGAITRPMSAITAQNPLEQNAQQENNEQLKAQLEQQQEMMRAMMQQMQQYETAQEEESQPEQIEELQQPQQVRETHEEAAERKSSSLPIDATQVLNKPFTPMPPGGALEESRRALVPEVTPEQDDTPQNVQIEQNSGPNRPASQELQENAPLTVQELPTEIQAISFSSKSVSNPFDKPNDLARDLAKLADQSGISSASISATQGRIKPLPNESEFSTEMGGSASGSHLFNDSESLPNVRFDQNVRPNTQVRNPFDAARDSDSHVKAGQFKYNQDQFNIFGNDSKSDTPFFPF